MPTTPLEWLVAIPVLLAVIAICAIALVTLPVIGITYYAARSYVRLIDRIGLGDN